MRSNQNRGGDLGKGGGNVYINHSNDTELAVPSQCYATIGRYYCMPWHVEITNGSEDDG